MSSDSRPGARPLRGVLHRDRLPERFEYRRYPPTDAVADRVECVWITRWDQGGLPPYEQEILPHPSVNVVVERHASGVFGVPTGRWTKVLADRSRAVGIKFHAGAFTAYPAADLTDRHRPLDVVFGAAGTTYEQRVLDTDDDAEVVDLAVRFAAAHCPPVDADGALVRRIVAIIRDHRELLRVDDVAARCGFSTRELQRLCRRRLGVSPKWLLQRYRLHEAVCRIEAGEPVDFAALAAGLGWYDQSHFVREFTRMVGRPPGRYRAALEDNDT